MKALLVGYQALLDHAWLGLVREAPHNGPWGSLRSGAMLMLSTAVADLYHDNARRRLVPWAGLVAVGAGLILAIRFAISKTRASASYVLLSIGMSGLVFWAIHLLLERLGRGLPVLSAWSRDALLLYLLPGVVIGLFALPPAPWWCADAAAWLVLVQAASLVGILSWVGLALDPRALCFSL